MGWGNPLLGSGIFDRRRHCSWGRELNSRNTGREQQASRKSPILHSGRPQPLICCIQQLAITELPKDHHQQSKRDPLLQKRRVAQPGVRDHWGPSKCSVGRSKKLTSQGRSWLQAPQATGGKPCASGEGSASNPGSEGYSVPVLRNNSPLE